MNQQPADDQRHLGMTNVWAPIIAAALGGVVLLWLLLFIAYRTDRLDAAEVASTTVLFVAPPLASYILLMELTRPRLPLQWQVVATFAMGFVWLLVQRKVILPAFDMSVSIGESVANLILLPTFGIVSWLAVRSFSYRRRLAKALELQEQTELSLLEAQLAPHTLFNMLNTVYSVLLTDHQKAIPLFLSMSEALRHVVDRTRRRWIALREELAFIENYAALERARSPERVIISVVAEGDLDVPVPPMLLATLFENAVKHGRYPDGTLQIDVIVSVGEARMYFEVRNAYPEADGSRANMGVGQINVTRRLQMLYPHRSEFHARGENGTYRATVSIEP